MCTWECSRAVYTMGLGSIPAMTAKEKGINLYMSSVTPVENSDAFEALLKGQQKQTVAKFGATWCGPCKVMAPGFVSVASLSPDSSVKFVEVDIDECWQSAEKYSVKSVPTLIVFEGGVEKKRNVGLLSSAKISEWLNEK